METIFMFWDACSYVGKMVLIGGMATAVAYTAWRICRS